MTEPPSAALWVFRWGFIHVEGSPELIHEWASFVITLVVVLGNTWVVLAPTSSQVSTAALSLAGAVIGLWFGRRQANGSA